MWVPNVVRVDHFEKLFCQNFEIRGYIILVNFPYP